MDEGMVVVMVVEEVVGVVVWISQMSLTLRQVRVDVHLALSSPLPKHACIRTEATEPIPLIPPTPCPLILSPVSPSHEGLVLASSGYTLLRLM